MKNTRDFFSKDKGIIVSLDVLDLKKLQGIVKKTRDIEGVVGYKISGRYSLMHGLKKVTKKLRKHTKLPIILDYQKAGTDTPHIEKASVEIWKDHIDAIIIFPMSGPTSMRKSIETMLKNDIIPIVGGKMTHEKYLQNEGGYITGVDKMYLEAAKQGVKYFVAPANKPERVKEIAELLKEYEPRLLMPGIGEQGGNIREAMNAAGERCYFIIGRSIIDAKDVRKACENFAKMVRG